MIAEILVRIFAPHSRDHVVPGGLFTTDTTLGWKLMPDRSLNHRTRYFDVRYDINDMGFRDPPRPIARQPQVGRVLLFGDSQTFGWGVTVAQRLSHLPDGSSPPIEIWNMSVPGYGLDQQVISFEESGESLRASGAILFVSGPTLERTRSSHIYRKPKPRFVSNHDGSLRLVPVGSSSSAWTGIVYRAISPFYLPYFIERGWRAYSARDREPIGAPSDASPKAGRRTVGEIPLALLLRARTISAAKGQRLAVLADLPTDATAQLRQFCEKNGIEFLAVPFPDGTPSVVFGPEDHHWRPESHRVLAGHLATLVRSWGPAGVALAGEVNFR